MSSTSLAFLLLSSIVSQAPPSTPEGRVLISSARTGKPDLFLVDPATGTTKNLTATNDRMELWPAWSADGKRIAMATWMDDATRVTEITVMAADGSERKRLTVPEDGGTCLCPTWAPDGKRIAYARVFGMPVRSEVRTVNLDGTEDKPIAENAGFPAWSPDGETIAFAHFDGENKTSRLATMRPNGTEMKDLTEARPDVAMLTAAWSPDGRWIAFPAPVGGSIELHRISLDGKLRTQLTHLGAGTLNPVWQDEDTIVCTMLQPQAGTAYVSLRADGTRLQVHALSKLEPANPMIRPAMLPPRSFEKLRERSSIRQVAHLEAAAPTEPRLSPKMMFRSGNRLFVDAVWNADGQSFAGIAPDGPLCLVDVSPEAIRLGFELPAHTGGVSAVAWAHDGKGLYTTGADKTIRLWNPPATEARAIAEMTDVGGSIAVHPEGKCVATAGADGKITILDPESLKVKKTITFDEKKTVALLGLVWSKDGRTLFAAGGSGSIAVLGGALAAFDPDTGETRWRTKSMLGTVAEIALSPDGTKLAGACGDTYIRIWDAASGKELHAMKGHADRVTSIAWATDGKTLASGSLDHTVRLWDANTGSLLDTLASHLGPVIRIHFRPDGKTLLSSGVDRVLLWAK